MVVVLKWLLSASLWLPWQWSRSSYGQQLSTTQTHLIFTGKRDSQRAKGAINFERDAHNRWASCLRLLNSISQWHKKSCWNCWRWIERKSQTQALLREASGGCLQVLEQWWTLGWVSMQNVWQLSHKGSPICYNWFKKVLRSLFFKI